MKALQTIGIWQAMRFVWFQWYGWLIHISLPPIRVWLLQLVGAKVGKDTVIMDVRFINMHNHGFSKLHIGDRCFIGDEAMLDVRGEITLEDDVTISNRTTIVTHINVGYPDHPLQKHYPMKESRVVIKRGAYVATGAILLPNVTIGKESIVAAGSVVTKSFIDHVLVAGVPAVIKKKLT
ncbi:MAG: acyltransferase [Patescibacteria group bacterium]